jgi:hypothetical protein
VAVKFISHRVKMDLEASGTHKDNFRREILSDVAICAVFAFLFSLYGYIFLKGQTREKKPSF